MNFNLELKKRLEKEKSNKNFLFYKEGDSSLQFKNLFFMIEGAVYSLIEIQGKVFFILVRIEIRKLSYVNALFDSLKLSGDQLHITYKSELTGKTISSIYENIG